MVSPFVLILSCSALWTWPILGIAADDIGTPPTLRELRPGEVGPNDPRPSIAFDYRVRIGAGQEECFFQHVPASAAYHVGFQVIRGGDGLAGFSVHNPHSTLVFGHVWNTADVYRDDNSMGGYYSVCIDNVGAHFGEKVVLLYHTIIRYDLWKAQAHGATSLSGDMQSIGDNVVQIGKHLNDVRQFQMLQKATEARDFNLLLTNNTYVQNWSLAQIAVIILTCAVQITFVRKLFSTPSTKHRRPPNY